jgi:hypothetical protein
MKTQGQTWGHSDRFLSSREAFHRFQNALTRTMWPSPRHYFYIPTLLSQPHLPTRALHTPESTVKMEPSDDTMTMSRSNAEAFYET